MIGSLDMILPVRAKKHFWQACECDGADQGNQADDAPSIRAERDDAKAIEQRDDCHCQKKRSCKVAMYTTATGSIGDAGDPHYAERDRPDNCLPTGAHAKIAGGENGDYRQAKQDKNQ